MMHELAEIIDDQHSLLAVCCNCGYVWDFVELYDAIVHNGDVAAVMNKWQNDPANADSVDPSEEGATSPLAQMMLANNARIDATIGQYGAAFVANWFMNTGAAIAALYKLVASGDMERPFVDVEENES